MIEDAIKEIQSIIENYKEVKSILILQKCFRIIYLIDGDTRISSTKAFKSSVEMLEFIEQNFTEEK